MPTCLVRARRTLWCSSMSSSSESSARRAGSVSRTRSAWSAVSDVVVVMALDPRPADVGGHHLLGVMPAPTSLAGVDDPDLTAYGIHRLHDAQRRGVRHER